MLAIQLIHRRGTGETICMELQKDVLRYSEEINERGKRFKNTPSGNR